MNKKITTLLQHPTSIEDDGLQMDARPPERLRGFAEKWLTKYGIKKNRALQAAMRSADNPVTHDAAWLRWHSIRGLELIAMVPEELREALRELWAHGFHAGARHESITVNLKYLKTVQARRASNAGYQKARKISAVRRTKVTDVDLVEMVKAGLTREQMAEKAGVSPQAIGKRLKKKK